MVVYRFRAFSAAFLALSLLGTTALRPQASKSALSSLAAPINWIEVLNEMDVLKPGGQRGEYLLKQELQLSVAGKPNGLILHSGSSLRLVSHDRVLVIHASRSNANALVPTSSILYVAIPDPKNNPDDPSGKDVMP